MGDEVAQPVRDPRLFGDGSKGWHDGLMINNGPDKAKYPFKCPNGACTTQIVIRTLMASPIATRDLTVGRPSGVSRLDS